MLVAFRVVHSVTSTEKFAVLGQVMDQSDELRTTIVVNCRIVKQIGQEVDWRKPGKRAHRQSVGAAVMDGKLFLKVRQRKERMERIKSFLVFPMAALHFAVMPGRVRTDELMPDAQLSGGFLKKGGNIPSLRMT